MTEKEIKKEIMEKEEYYMGVCYDEKLDYDTNQMNINEAWEKSLDEALKLQEEKLIKIIKDFKGEEYTDLEIWKEIKKDLLKGVEKIK